MQILVMTTGGTIGSVLGGGSIDVSESASAAVVEMYRADRGDADFTVISPVNILSECLSARDLSALAKAILTTDYAPYDGVIFTCGSDNLAYIASFIGLLGGSVGLPAAVVASDGLLTLPTSNGYPNFCTAVELIRRGEAGVFVPYRNRDGVMYIHSATEIRQADLSPDIYSYGGAYAVFDGGVIEKRPYVSHTVPSVFGADRLPVITDSVAMIHPYPMLDYSSIGVSGKKAVLHTLYHSSTLDSDRAVRFITDNEDIPVFLSSFVRGKTLYRTSVEAVEAGAIPLYDMAPECAYMKLLLAAAQDEMSVTQFMAEDIAV